jgi:hypothetical protein
MNKRKSIIVLLVLLAAFGYFKFVKPGSFTPKSKFEFQKGICYVTWNKEAYASQNSNESLEVVKSLGTTWIAVVPTWYQDKCSSNRIYPMESTPSDESVIRAITQAHSLGLKVMLKPHLDMIDTTEGSFRGEISCSTNMEWDNWFKNYRDFIVHYAKIAQLTKCELFCIGTELTSIATIKEEKWKTIVIPSVKAAYSGPLTYAANWHDEYQYVKFWDKMDYVGIDAYFPLSDKDIPTYEEIKAGWAEWVKDMEEFQRKINKPIIFPEVGYCSANGITKMPWEEAVGRPLNMKLQEDCYRAIFEIFWPKEWFYGVYWWKWGTNKNLGGKGNKGYTPQNKPAQGLIKEWYKRSAPKRTMY